MLEIARRSTRKNNARRFLLKCLFVGIAIGISPSASASLVTNISTGWDNGTNSRIANGLPDSKYIIGPGGSGGDIGQVPIVPSLAIPASYYSDLASSASRWITIADFNVPIGTYYFNTAVDLTGFAAITAQLSGVRYAVDNKLVNVEVNGISVYSQPIGYAEDFSSFHSLGNLGLGLFHSGTNLVSFEVYNSDFINPQGGTNPMAFRMEATVTAMIPEPSSAMLAGLGLAGLVALSRRRRKSLGSS
jgi:hypothetical protein